MGLNGGYQNTVLGPGQVHDAASPANSIQYCVVGYPDRLCVVLRDVTGNQSAKHHAKPSVDGAIRGGRIRTRVRLNKLPLSIQVRGGVNRILVTMPLGMASH